MDHDQPTPPSDRDAPASGDGPAGDPRRPVLRLFPVLLLNLIAFAIAIPVLPALTYDLGGDAVDVGFLYAIQAFGQFVMAPAWGALSDRFGRKPILIATFLLAAVFELGTAVTTSLWLLYVMRLLVGMSLGNVATASALIADATDASSRSKGMAVIGISFGIGFTIGTATGAGLSMLEQAGPGLLGSGLPFAAAAGLQIVAALLGLVLLVEPVRAERARRQNRIQIGPRKFVARLRDRPVAIMCAIFFFYTLATTIMEGTFFVYAEATYGFEEREVGLIFAGFGLLMALVQGGIGRLSKWLGDRRMTLVGLVLFAVGLTLAPITGGLWFLLVFLGIATIGRALIHPGVLSITSRVPADARSTGEVMGVLQSSGSLARVLGPAAAGLIFRHVAHIGPFLAAGILLALATLWWSVASRTLPVDEARPAG